MALHWRLIQPRYNLVGTKCINCDEHFFPPRNLCPTCRRKSKIEGFKFSGKGKVYTFSVIHAAPTGFEFQKPYAVAIVELEEGTMLTTQIVDIEPELIEIGMPVEMTFRKIMADNDAGIIRYGYKFRPIKKDLTAAKRDKGPAKKKSKKKKS